MRRQYHFRESERGLLTWNVDRLVRLAEPLPRRQVPLGEIRELDEVYWFDEEDAQPTCRAIAEHARLINESDLDHPIILSADGRVMDGMHRVLKAYLAGLATIEAVRFEVDPEPDYVGMDPESLPYD